MARIREFDANLALDAALQLFWERGYDATSMADLVERTGVARAGLYEAFGNKHDLYVAALERYAVERDKSVVEMLERPGSPMGNVRAVLERYATGAREDPLRKGCLVVNSAVELAERDTTVASLVERSWRTVAGALTTALTVAQDAGEIPRARSPQSLAHMIVVFLQGLQVLGRVPKPPFVQETVTTLLETLD